MSKTFNLLSLHQSEDIHPRTWICLKGPYLNSILKDLEKEILENKGWNREKLSGLLANRLGCAHNTISYTLQGRREFYPIAIILELLRLSKNKKIFLRKIKQNITHLKVNSASAKPVKALYKINENLAKILGAFMADGSLSVQVVFASSHVEHLGAIKNILTKANIYHSIGIAPSRNQHYISIQANESNFKDLKVIIRHFQPLTQIHHTIELTEEYKDNVEAFIGWVKEEFYILPNSFKKRGNVWRAIFSNKILARYFMVFFDVIPGPKCYSAFEPKIIKRSSLKFRIAFARGVLMFDGCVTKQKIVTLNVVSQKLSRSVGQIWKRDGIKSGESTYQRSSGYSLGKNQTFFTVSTTTENKEWKLLNYFETNTQKWKMINWLSGKLNNPPILKENSSFSIKKLLGTLRKVGRCDSAFLENHFKVSHTTIRSHLKILKNQGAIRLSNTPNRINSHIDENTMVFLKSKHQKLLFKKIIEKFKKDKHFANFIGIHKANISNWRIGKTRISIHHLKETCDILNINFDEISKNIAQTDREIAEII